uniref:Uncharacterized protein n=1 Tax=Oryza brachyantha TaxID=4533 RepID=J3ME06_ORYBR
MARRNVGLTPLPEIETMQPRVRFREPDPVMAEVKNRIICTDENISKNPVGPWGKFLEILRIRRWKDYEEGHVRQIGRVD